MRFAMFSLAGDASLRLGLAVGDSVVDVKKALSPRWREAPGSLVSLVAAGPDAWRRVGDLLHGSHNGASYATDEIRWHAPIPRPAKNVICIGRNYAKHVREGALARGQEVTLPAHAHFFSKLPTTVNGPFDDIAIDETVTQQVDWEVELGVLIGIAGRNISRAEALEHVFGYTVINDVTARDLQARHVQAFKGKSLDGFCPMGPVVVTADEFGDPQQKSLRLRVNGVTKQDGHTSDMIFDVATIISTFSQGVTLEPGDILSTGTPDGVGFGRTPPEFLRPGDIVETEVEGIGTLRNVVTTF